MKALVTNIKIISKNLTEKEQFYKDLFFTIDNNRLYILFDENMGIEPESGFLGSFQNITDDYLTKICNRQTAQLLQIEITNLLIRMKCEGHLFVGETLNLMKNKRDDLVLLTNDNYEVTKKFLEKNKNTW